MKVEEWHDRSFFVELKPRSEFANLFVDCPPKDQDDKESVCSVVRVGENCLSLEVSASLEEVDSPLAFRARIQDLSLSPQSVCAPTWTDNRRLFMCKVHAEASNFPLVPRTFSRLAREMSASSALEEFVNESQNCRLLLQCGECNAKLIDSKGEIELGFVPSDDWMDTTTEGDFYCRDSCGAACDPHRNAHGSGMEAMKRHEKWTPRPDYALLAHTNIIVHEKSLVDGSVSVMEKQKEREKDVIRCSSCRFSLGRRVRNCAESVQLHLAVTNLHTKHPTSYIETRFGDKSTLFAMLILSQCESQSSLKLVVRSLDRTPHLLVWLLDSYVVLTAGELVAASLSSSSLPSFRPFPALKMLYKVFDAKSAATDPRANGEDASVGVLDVPLGCCLQMMEDLLRSSLALPPACRSVGQFYVGFLQLNQTIC